MIDVSIPLEPETTVWPGDPPFAMQPLARMADGDICNVSELSLGTHCGTHVDAPWHFLDSAGRLDTVDTDLFFGDALVADCGDAPCITADILPAAPLPPRVLFRTRNSVLPVRGPFHNDFVALDAGAARRLVDDGVKLVGVDYLSIAPNDESLQQQVHEILLGAGVLIVEGLRLGAITPGVAPFIVLPLRLVGADGAPCRAFVGQGGPD